MCKIYITNGRSKKFICNSENESIEIYGIKYNRCTYVYKYSEIYDYLFSLYNIFAFEYFSLKNNIDKSFYLTEEKGLGSVIYKVSRNISKVQGASYLGVVLQDAKILHWNSLNFGIKWKINEDFFPLDIMRIKNAIINGNNSQEE